MDLKIIQEFVVLSDIMNFARAADALFTTQATLSRHIMSLEKELGKPLFSRTTRKVELTEFGAAFLPYAKRLVQTWEECGAYLLSPEGAGENRVVVGISGPILQEENIKNTFIKFNMKNPDCKLEFLQDDEEDELLNKLRRRECDLAVLREPLPFSDAFQRMTIGPVEPLCVLLPKQHPLSGADSVMLDELRNEYFLPPPSCTNTYKSFIERCRQIGFEPKTRVPPLRGREVAASMANNGLGIPVLSRNPAMAAADPTVSVVRIYPPINQAINIIYPKLSKLPKATAQLLEAFRELSR